MIRCTIWLPDDRREYGVVVGNTLSEEFGETLDSAKVAIGNVPKEARITSSRPYSPAVLRISENDREKVYSMLIDDITETREGMFSTGEFLSYDISLMSLTKLLEKVQLPNRTFTRPLEGRGASVMDAIEWLWDAYCPKIRKSNGDGTWSYGKIIALNPADPKWDRFKGTECADMGMSQPTLRQALTSIMVQCNALPKVDNWELGYLDLGANPTAFGQERLNQFASSNASDSFVTELVSMPSNALDEESTTINEVLGFRDRERVFLKASENLKLNTRFKIREIRSASMMFYNYANLSAHYGTARVSVGGKTVYPEISADESGNYGLYVTYDIGDATETSEIAVKATISRIDASSGRWVGRESKEISTNVTIPPEGQIRGSIRVSDLFRASHYPSAGDAKFGYVFTVARVEIGGKVSYCADTMSSTLPPWQPLRMFMQYDSGKNDSVTLASVATIWKKDITPLVVESGRRSLLDSDYLAMKEANPTTAADLSKWVFGTVGYSVGGTEISGFSQTYTEDSGWFKKGRAYIENILNVLYTSDPKGEEFPTVEGLFGDEGYFGGAIDGKDVNSSSMEPQYNDVPGIVNPWDFGKVATTGSGYPFLFFSVAYVPLNDLHARFVKSGDYAFALQQLDQSGDGLTSLRSFSLSEGEKARRLGNDVLSIHERFGSLTDFLDSRNGLNQRLSVNGKEYLTFSRTVSFNGSAVDVSYHASKDYILRNYFTSVRTKYRSFENVDYSSATLRKESRLVHLDISDSYYNASDSLVFGRLDMGEGKALEAQRRFLDAPFAENLGMFRYGFTINEHSSEAERFLAAYELSTVSVGGKLILTMRDYDNASMGVYLTPRATGSDGEYVSEAFGQPQAWYGFEGYSKRHFVGFANDIGYFAKDKVYGFGSDFRGYMESVIGTPKVSASVFRPENDERFDGVFLVDGNEEGGARPVTFHKDASELLQTSLQFEYGSRSSRLRLFPPFAEATSAGGRRVPGELLFHIGEPKGLDRQEDATYASNANRDSVPKGLVTWTSDADSHGHASFTIDWEKVPGGERKVLTLTYVSGNVCTDLASFVWEEGNPTKDKWFLNPNDSNSVSVYEMDTGQGNSWKRVGEIETNTNKRTFKGL